MKNPVLLCRMDLMDNKDELFAVKEFWPNSFFYYRSIVPENSTVIGRYSVLPFYKELEKELNNHRKSNLINTYEQHNYISKMDWYFDVFPYTPETWFDVGYKNVPYCENGYVAKGETNSRKFKWNTCMYAKDRESLKSVMDNLREDTLISQQRMVVREYIPLETFETGINGLPFSNEWRFFFLAGQMISHGFYWSISEKIPEMIDEGGFDFARRMADIVSKKATFFALDIARTKNGDWILIEVNDGQMSGLSTIDARRFYSNLLTASNHI